MTQTSVATPFALPEGYYQSFSHTVNGKTIRVWAIKENWNYFVTDTGDAAKPVVPVTWTVPGGKVRRYPGDASAYTRGTYTATRALPVTRGKAIPGKPFALEDGNEFRVFSYVGSLTALYNYLAASVKADCALHTPTGRTMPIVKGTTI